jgi:hypothetical protein
MLQRMILAFQTWIEMIKFRLTACICCMHFYHAKNSSNASESEDIPIEWILANPIIAYC